MEIIGSGGYGLVISKDDKVLKLFYDYEDCKGLSNEAKIQKEIREIVLKINENNKNNPRYLGMNVPEIYEVYNKHIHLDFNNLQLPKDFLCGILMERIKPPEIDGFGDISDTPNEQIHIGLGLRIDCNISWICDNGITRGFYANTKMLEAIIEEFNGKYPRKIFSVSNIAYTFGKVYSEVFNKGYKLFDIEIVLGEKNGNLTLNMIDFGKVYNYLDNNLEEKSLYYYDDSYRGLISDSYVPHKNHNDKYWEDFYEGYFG